MLDLPEFEFCFDAGQPRAHYFLDRAQLFGRERFLAGEPRVQGDTQVRKADVDDQESSFSLAHYGIG